MKHTLESLNLTLLDPPAGALPITHELAAELGLTGGEKRLEVKSFGPWQIPVSVRGICMHSHFDKSRGYTVTRGECILGVRTMTNPRQSGYQMEGQVSVGGRKVRAFTSSQLFELPDGRLVDAGIIFACI